MLFSGSSVYPKMKHFWRQSSISDYRAMKCAMISTSELLSTTALTLRTWLWFKITEQFWSITWKKSTLSPMLLDKSWQVCLAWFWKCKTQFQSLRLSWTMWVRIRCRKLTQNSQMSSFLLPQMMISCSSSSNKCTTLATTTLSTQK